MIDLLRCFGQSVKYLVEVYVPRAREVFIFLKIAVNKIYLTNYVVCNRRSHVVKLLGIYEVGDLRD